ncbi:MAG: hypothetical protein JSS51_03625 [Planctomycetes bacterium]|nr:hypothetical protein [Planctomycetota bacterium]
MRAAVIIVVAALLGAAGCASNSPPPPLPVGTSGDFTLQNQSTATIRVRAYEREQAAQTRTPLGPAFDISPGSTDSRTLGVPGRVIVITVAAIDAHGKLANEWVVTERPGGFRLYAFTDHADTVRLNWNGPDGEVVLEQ